MIANVSSETVIEPLCARFDPMKMPCSSTTFRRSSPPGGLDAAIDIGGCEIPARPILAGSTYGRSQGLRAKLPSPGHPDVAEEPAASIFVRYAHSSVWG